jgi:ribosome-associated toxin RatA of RatAB toxin-antitoxin module
MVHNSYAAFTNAIVNLSLLQHATFEPPYDYVKKCKIENMCDVQFKFSNGMYKHRFHQPCKQVQKELMSLFIQTAVSESVEL